MWKNDRFFEERKVIFSPKIAAALLKNGKADIKKLYSPKTGKTYAGSIVLADTGVKMCIRDRPSTLKLTLLKFPPWRAKARYILSGSVFS